MCHNRPIRYEIVQRNTFEKMLKDVEAGLLDIDRPPKLSRADYRLNDHDQYIHITAETLQTHPSTGECLSPLLGGETMPRTLRMLLDEQLDAFCKRSNYLLSIF